MERERRSPRSAITLHVLRDVLVELLAPDRYAGAAVVVFPLAMTRAIQGVGWVLEPDINVSKRSYLSLVSYATGLTVLVTLVWPVVEARAGWARLVARGG